MREYDLDAHVRRTFERQSRARQNVVLPAEQLALFDTGTFKRRLQPKLVTTRDGLVVDDEMLFSRCVSLHSLEKAYGARRYAEIVGTAMAGKFPALWWVELFAGPGRLLVRDTGKFVDGSPVEALNIRRPFDGYVFADLSLPCVESLRRRVGLAPNAHVLAGNANSPELLDRIASIVPRDALVVLYADPEGLELDWSTIEYFIDRYPVLDILVNVPVTGVIRYLLGGHTERAISMLNHPTPHNLVETEGTKGALLREWMTRNLDARGFKHIYDHPVRLHRRNRVLYDLVLASHHPLAKRFFEIAIADYIADDTVGVGTY
jgi:three-Cys-motif partner protein